MFSMSCHVPRNWHQRLVSFVLLAMIALSAGGCQSTTTGSSLAADSESPGGASIMETARAGQAWRADPKNIELGLKYAAQLQALGQFTDQMKVLDELTRRNPNDAKLAAYYGKQLTARGRVVEGERTLRRLVAAGNADWTVHSALGSALDQQGKFTEAREQYAVALKAGANQITVLNNIGMSYMLEGDLNAAEKTLREASRLPGGDVEPRVRQNLALAVGLQGRFEEAREIASRDLPAEMVEANMAYLRSMLSQPNTWQKLKPTAS